MKTYFITIAVVLFSFSLSHAHGKSLKLASPDDLVKFYPGGEKLAPADIKTKSVPPYEKDAGVMKWMKVVDTSGKALGYVGIEKVATPHGRLTQATCFNEGMTEVLKVKVLRVMEDEAALIKEKTSKYEWWKAEPPGKARDAWGALSRSVARVMAAAGL